MALDNTLEYIDGLYDTNPGSLLIPRLQESIPGKDKSLSELTDKIGTGFFVVDSQNPDSLDQNGQKP